MNIREDLERRERETLSQYAAFSAETKGREREDARCDIRLDYQRDRDRILHSKSFRRLKEKTQVFLTPEGDHYRTRLTHTLEVAQNARTIAKALRLNEELTEAIALGHDLGHTPFGHAGERALARICPLGFSHSEQSVRTVEVLEKAGLGLNLTFEVRDGIKNHQTSGNPKTLEAQIVRFSDKIAYMYHDMHDAVRAGILAESDVPREISDIAGKTSGERLDFFIHNLVSESYGQNDIRLPEMANITMKKLRDFMFERVYQNTEAKSEEKKAEAMMEMLYNYYLGNINKIPIDIRKLLDIGDRPEQIVCDYLSAMTDRFAIAQYEELFVPKSWIV
ncbi:MAG: deoxyguanosinetriphosphate triphosphohydrolase [Lachnospiraceae bacterium]|nr:deoxyguanosinetriphosphate triphosphohydrolase [Lachnospiraceae bacterium]